MTGIGEFLQGLQGLSIEDAVCEIMRRYGPDGQSWGSDIMTLYVGQRVAAEREMCAQIADANEEGWRTGAYHCDHIAAAIRARK